MHITSKNKRRHYVSYFYHREKASITMSTAGPITKPKNEFDKNGPPTD
jgi:hypothetical protein